MISMKDLHKTIGGGEAYLYLRGQLIGIIGGMDTLIEWVCLFRELCQ